MPTQLPIIANENPALIFHKEITFSTQDEITGQNIIEGYNLTPPVNSTFTAMPLPGGVKYVVPITSDTGSGAPFLKFHFPNGTSSNKMYVTFAVKNSRMADGYYDYKTGIPTVYKNQLKNFILSPINAVQLFNVNGSREKIIRFTAYGSSTNKPAEAVTFKISFKAIFSASAISSTTAGAVVGVPAGGGSVTTTGGATTNTGNSAIQLTGFPGNTANTNLQTRGL